MLTYRLPVYLISASILTLFLSSCFELFDDGTNTLMKSSSNNLKTKKAVSFLKSGNATTGESLHVSILNHDQDLEDTENGNALTTDSNHGRIILDSGAIDFRWISNDSLLITYDKDLRTFTKLHEANDIRIRYVEVD